MAQPSSSLLGHTHMLPLGSLSSPPLPLRRSLLHPELSPPHAASAPPPRAVAAGPPGVAADRALPHGTPPPPDPRAVTVGSVAGDPGCRPCQPHGARPESRAGSPPPRRPDPRHAGRTPPKSPHRRLSCPVPRSGTTPCGAGGGRRRGMRAGGGRRRGRRRAGGRRTW